MNLSNSFESPFATKYASQEMLHLFSRDKQFKIWRQLWIALAEAQKKLGLNISQSQIDQLKAHQENLNYSLIEKYENEMHHDVMAHIYAYGEQCHLAKPILHLGATSSYVKDNADLILIRDALKLIENTLLKVLHALAKFAETYAELPCLGYTHLQPAQLTTLGKRACLWLHDFSSDEEQLHHRLHQIKFLGVKGSIGTQATFLSLFNGDQEKVLLLEKEVARAFGFTTVYPIASQTYPRKEDLLTYQVLQNIGVSAYKIASDIRLMAGFKEIEEPFYEKQIGSSAMPHKRNPILSERICGLSRYLLSLNSNFSYNAADQWLERTLDDSANRRITIPEAFLACDSILNLLHTSIPHLKVNEQIIEKHVKEELPFMAAETILMEAVKSGGDRQELHEKLKIASHAAIEKVKKGEEQDFFERLRQDPTFQNIDFTKFQPKEFTGRASQQVKEFLKHKNW